MYIRHKIFYKTQQNSYRHTKLVEKNLTWDKIFINSNDRDMYKFFYHWS